jgi:O-antigen/teichoic acid export membrane protein
MRVRPGALNSSALSETPPPIGISGLDNPPPQEGQRASRFFVGVLWNWVGVALNIAIGLLLSPYIARKLGSERYGIWALVFSLVEYLWFFDLGFNTSVTQFVAKYRARNEPDQINRVINTGLLYFCAVAIVFALATLLVAWRGVAEFKIADPVNREDFRSLILIVGLGWAFNFPLHFFSSCLDAFQRYDHLTRTWVAQLLIRSVGCALLLYFGFGLKELGAVVVLGQLVGNSLALMAFRSVFPQMRLSSLHVKFALVKEMWSYGVHSFIANISNLLLSQGAPVMIGHFRLASFVGYYTFPSRLLGYSVEAVTRIGFVTRSNVVEMQAKGDEKAVYSLGIYLNRYCVTLFLPLVIYLLVYGTELLRRWVNQEFATECGPLLPVISLTTMFAVAGQFNSTSMLYGLSRHDRMAKGLLVEALLGVLGIYLVLPHYGILGVAWVLGMLSVLNRGLYVPWLVCRALDSSFPGYMWGIYARPVLTAVPVFLLAQTLKSAGVSGQTWRQLILMGAFTSVAFFLPAFFTCVTREHRKLMLDSVTGMVGRLFARLLHFTAETLRRRGKRKED